MSKWILCSNVSLTSAILIQSIVHTKDTIVASIARYVAWADNINVLLSKTLLNVTRFSDIKNRAISNILKLMHCSSTYKKWLFIQVSLGYNLFPDYDWYMLTFLFPYLDLFALKRF